MQELDEAQKKIIETCTRVGSLFSEMQLTYGTVFSCLQSLLIQSAKDAKIEVHSLEEFLKHTLNEYEKIREKND